MTKILYKLTYKSSLNIPILHSLLLKHEMVSDPAVLFLFLLFSNAQMMMTRKLTVVTLNCEPGTSEAKYIYI